MNGFKNEEVYNAVYEAVKDAISDFYDTLEYFAVRFENGGIWVYVDDFVVGLDADGGHIVAYEPQGEPLPMGTDICGAVWYLGLNADMIYKTFWDEED